MYNALNEIPQISKLVQVGVRDYGGDEWEYIKNSDYRVITYFDKEIKNRQFEGETWKNIADEIVSKLPQQVYISFDIDGLDRKLCLPYRYACSPAVLKRRKYFIFSER
jgi:agmatinase